MEAEALRNDVFSSLLRSCRFRCVDASTAAHCTNTSSLDATSSVDSTGGRYASTHDSFWCGETSIG